MAELGRLTAVFDADTRKFDAGVRGVGAKVVALESNLKGLSSGGTSAISTLSGLAGPLSIAAGGAVIAASAIGGLVKGLFELVKSSAKVGGELFDLSQKTSFMVETLSGLSIVAKTTGSDIQSISASLIIFQKNMGAAQDATSKQGQLFKSLNIDTRDNEKALRQAFTALAKYGDTQKGVEVATKLFGRSGAAVLAIVKETNGNLDAAIKKYSEMGLVISGQAAAASDRFNDLLEETTLQLEAVTRSIGMELLPVATDALQSISASLKANKDEWASWGTSIANVLRGLTVVVNSEVGQWIGTISTFLVKYASLPGLILQGLGSLGANADRPSEDFFGPGGAGRGGRSSLPGTPEWRAQQKRLAGLSLGTTSIPGGGGGGRRGGGAATDPAADMKRMADLQVRIALEGLHREESDIQRSYDLRRTTITTYQRAMSRLEEEHNKTVLDALNSEEAAINRSKKLTKVEKSIALQEIELKRLEEANRHQEREADLADKILGITRERIALTETLIRQQSRLRFATDVILQDLGGGSVQVDEATRNAATRPRTVAIGGLGGIIGEVGVKEDQLMRDRIEKIRDQMRGLSYELTDIWFTSVRDGFERGIGAGLQSLGLGLLRVLEDVFFRRMAEGLSQVLGNIAVKNSGGGGFWSTILRAVVGGAAGGAGGTIGGIGGAAGGSAGGTGGALAGVLHFSSGGVVPGVDKGYDSVLAMLRPGETVTPRGQSGATVVNHYTINLPPAPKGSYVSPKSARQQAELIMAHLQGSQS